MKHPLVDTKYLIIDWNTHQRFKYRHNKSVKSVYVQIWVLEIGFWYG